MSGPITDIIVDCTELYANPTRTGIQRVVREMLRHWPGDGPRIHLARFDGHGLAALPDRVLHMLTDNEPDAIGLSVTELAQRLALARTTETVRLPAAPMLIPEVFYDPARAAFHCARVRTLGQPLAMIAYDFLPFLQPEMFGIRRNAELMWYIKTIQTATSVAHISGATKQAYERRVMRGKGTDGPVLPLGADGLALERQRWRPDRQGFVTLGSIDGRKNQQVILGAFQRLWDAGHHAPLVMIGNVFAHMDDRWLHDALACPQFRWLRHAHDADIAAEFRQARATIYASTAEGFGLPPVESLAASLPVIASADIPSLAMLPPAGQLRLEKITEQAIADAVLALMDDEAAERLWMEAATLELPTWKDFGRMTAEWVGGAPFAGVEHETHAGKPSTTRQIDQIASPIGAQKMVVMTADSLGSFIKEVDEDFQGDLNHPTVVSRYYPIDFKFSTVVDQDLDPFSSEYYDQQISLYREITQRDLDQWSGELHPVDVPALAMTANPLGLRNVGFVAEHVRAISSMLGVCNLGENARVLDLGAGHGLSSEVMAFCGCAVHAIDIDPKLGELSDRRAAQRGLEIERSVLSYDDLSAIEDDVYAAAFFFQSFHHCLKPWELIATLKRKLVEGGVIAFTGEPIYGLWRNWGIRLDQESLYVARKFGWFESGWTHGFLHRCFERNGFQLGFVNGGHGGGQIGIASTSAASVREAVATARRLGFTEYQAP